MPTPGKRQLEVVLSFRDNLSGKAPRTVKALRSIEGQAKKTVSAVEKLNKVMGGALGGRRSGGSRLSTELQTGVRLSRQLAAEAGRGLKLETQQAKLLRERTRARAEGVRLAREEARLSEQITRQSARAATPARRRASYQTGDWMRDSDRPRDWRRELGEARPPRISGERPRRAGTFERAGHLAGRTRDAYSDFRDAYGQARDQIREYTDPASELMRARMRLGTLGLNSEEATRADAAIRQTVAAVPGSRLSEVTQAFAELYEVFASVDDTARNIRRAAQYSFSMKTIHGDLYSPEQLITQTKAAYKFVDLIGLTKPDAQGRVDNARVDEYHDRLMQVLSATGGEVNPREMLQAAKIGGTSLIGMSREGLTHIASLASDVTGSRAGNMQRSMLQSFVGGKLFDSNVDALAQYGMVDRSKIRKQRNGKLDIQPGGIRYADTISTDPLIFIDKLAEGMRAKGVDTNVEKDVINATAKLTPNSLAQNMIAQAIIRREEMTRFDELVAKGESLGKMFARSEVSPLGRMEDARAKAENWRATAGGPMLEAGGQVSSYLAPFYAELQKFSEGSPVLSAALAGITSLGGASLSAGEGVGTLASLLRELRGGGGGGTSGSGGGILGTGYGVSDVATGGYMGWHGVRAGLRWGGRGLLAAGTAIGGAAVTPYVAAALATTAGGIGLYTRHRAVKAGEGADSAAQGLYDSVRQLREQSGGRLPADVARNLGATAFMQLDRAGDLTTKLEPGFYGAYQRLYDPSAFRGWVSSYDPERAPEVFRQRSPVLGFPEVMRTFIDDVTRRVGAGQISKEAGDRTLKAAQATFPESFAKASVTAAEAVGKLPEPATQTGKALAEILGPARNLPPSLASLVFSFDSAAAQIRALEIRAPSITLPPSGGSTGTGKPKTGNRLIDSYDPLGGFRERGGPVRRGVSYVVGEAGAELFTPGADGFITPHDKLGWDAPSRRAFDLPNLLPQSSVGSVIQSDGAVNLHRGNVVFPAKLSRRSPGDWLKSAEAIRASVGRWRRAPGDELRRALPRLPRELPASSAEWRDAAGSVRERVAAARRAPAEELRRTLPGVGRWLHTVEAVRGMVGRRGARDDERPDAAEVIGGVRPRRASADELMPSPVGPSALPALPGDWMAAAGASRPRFAKERRAPAADLLPPPRLPAEGAEGSEGAGPVDYSQFAPGRSGGGGREIIVHVGGVHVTGGADAHATGAAVAEEVERQVREALARIAALESDVYDPRFIGNMVARDVNWQRERV